MKSRTRKRLIALGLVLVICAGGALALRQLRAVRKAASLQESRDLGMAAYDEGDWHEALEHLGSYIRRSGASDADALYRLADARLRIPEPDNSHLTLALRSAIDAEAADPSNADARRLLLDLYIRRGQFVEALETLTRALETQPRDRELLEKRVEILGGLGRWPEARDASLALATAFPADPEVHRRHLEVIVAEGDDDAAHEIREYLGVATEAMEPGADLEIFRAEALVTLGDGDGALAACRAVLQAGPTTGEQFGRLLDTLDSLAGFDQTRADALELVQQAEERALAMSPAPEDVGVALVSRWYRRNMDARVERALAGAIAAPADASDAALGWAAVAGDPRGAFAEPVRAALASRQSDEAAFWTAAAAASDALQESDPRAIEPAREAVGLAENLDRSRRDERALAMYLQAGAEEVRGASIIAEEGFRQVASQARWHLARAAYINHLLDRGAYGEALEALNQSAFVDPVFIYTPDGLLLRASALIGMAEGAPRAGADLAEAIRILDFFIGHTGERSGLYLGLLARARAAAGDLDAAALAVDQMLVLGDDLSVRELVKTGSALRERAPEIAERLLAEARRRDPGDVDLLFSEAIAAVRDGRRDDAMGMLSSGIAAAEGDERLRLRLLRAQIHDTVGEVEDALRDLNALASEFPDDLTVQRAVLESRAAWGEQPVVRAAIARVRAISGEESSAWRIAEARRLLTFSPNQQRASEALAGALEPLLRSGGDARAHALAAEAWLILGDRDEAITAYERAVGAAGDRAAVYPRLITLLLQSGRVDDARERLRAFALEGSLGAEASRQRATMLAQLEMWDEAIAERERLAALGGFEDQLALGIVLTSAGRFDQAQDVVEGLLGSSPPTPQLVAAAARLRGLQRDVPGGLALFDRLSGVVPDDERVLLMGDYLWAAGERDQARRLVQGHAEDASAGASVWLWLARAAFEAGDADAGRDAVARGLQADSTYAPLLVLRRLEQEGVTDPATLAAMAAGGEGEGAEPVVREFNDLLLAFSREQITAEAFEERLAAITAEYPLFVKAWSALTMLRLASGDAEGAARAAAEAMRVVPGDPRPARMAAQVHGVLGRHDQALAAARTWRDRTPADPIDADLFITELYLLMDRPADAAAVLNPWKPVILGASDPDPDQAGILARVVAATGPAAARADLVSRAASSPIWATACIDAAADVPEPAERRAWLERVGAAAGLSDQDVLDLGEQWTLLGDASGSASDFEAALEILGARRWEGALAGRAALHRGLALRRLGRLDESEREYRAVIQSNASADSAEALGLARSARGGLLLLVVEDAPDRAAAIAADVAAFWDAMRADSRIPAEQRAASGDAVARFHLAAGDPARAVQALEQALVLLPRDQGLQARMVQCLLAAGDREGAGQAIDRGPTREAQVRTMLAAADLIGGERPADAEWLLRRAYALNRDNFMVTNNLAYHLVTHGGDASDAAGLAQEAVNSVLARDPRPELLANVYDTLGTALLAAGRADEAEQAFQRGLDAQAGNAALQLGLAEALEAQGRTPDAKRVLDTIDRGALTEFSPQQRGRFDRLAEAIAP